MPTPFNVPVASFKTTITSRVTATGTTIGLDSVEDAEGNNLSGTFAFIIDEGTNTEEFVIGTIDAANSRITSCLRGISVVNGASEVAALQFAHRKKATIKITTHPYLLLIMRAINGTDGFNSANWTGVSSISGLALPTAGETTKAASVAYVNNVSLAGVADSSTTTKGVVEKATQAEVAAGTAAGSTTGPLFVGPADLATTIQSGSFVYALEDGVGANDAYTAALTPAIAAYTTGMLVLIKLTIANTGAATLALNGLAVKNIKKYAAGALADPETGDIVANMACLFWYDGTNMVLLNPGATMPTTALLSEMSTFFGATDMTGAEAETLTSGPTSDASAKHTHNDLVSSHVLSFAFSSTNGVSVMGSSGFSDATEDILALGAYDSTADFGYAVAVGLSADIGTSPYIISFANSIAESSTGTAATNHPLYIGTDYWISDTTIPAIYKNGSVETVSGTRRDGPLGHDVTNTRLLVLYSTTKIAKFSGIATGTITNLSSDVTLDTAVSQVGFVYDAANTQFVCVDLTANLLRKFNSSGVTVETKPYTVNDANVKGVALIGDRYYLVSAISNGGVAGATQTINPVTVSLIPTTMKRG